MIAYTRYGALAGAVALVMVLTAPAPGQLLPGSPAPQAGPPHVTWKVSMKPASVESGGVAEIEAEYRLLEGWHLYSPDFKGIGLPTTLKLQSEKARLIGSLTFPKPTEKDFPGLGTQRLLEGTGVLRQKVRIDAGTPTGGLKLPVLLSWMTCNDQTCDLPVRDKPHEVSVTVLARAQAPPAETSPAETSPAETPPTERPTIPGLPGLPGLPGSSDPGLPGSDPGLTRQAHVTWKVTVDPAEIRPGGTTEIAAEYTLAESWHLYPPDFEGIGVATAVGVESEVATLVGKPTFPQPEVKTAGGLGEQRVLEGTGVIRQKVRFHPDTPQGDVELKVLLSWMTCNDKNCDLPQMKKPHSVVVRVAGEPVAAATPEATTDADAEGFGTQSLWVFILLMIGGGIFALVMPCTYPMIPITFSFFTKQADARQGSVLPLSLAYGAGIILVFNVIGWIVWGAARLFQTKVSVIDYASNPYLNLIIAVVFVLFGLSLLGLFTLRLPAFVSNIGARAGTGSGYVGVFLLGTTLVIASFTCTAPIMGGLLAVAVKGADLGRITLGMTVFGLTMALPFVLLSLFPARIKALPRSGEWMNTIKVFLGFVELAAALKFFSNAELVWKWGVLTRPVFLALWAVLFSLAGLYLLGLLRKKGAGAETIGLRRRVAGIACLGLVAYCIWGAFGGRLDTVMLAIAPPQPHPAYAADDGLGWTLKRDLEEGLEAARKAGKRALINFTGEST